MNFKPFFSLLIALLLQFNQISCFDNEPDWREFKFRGGETVLGSSKYLTKVGQRTIEIFEEKHVSGANLPILDQSISINETVQGFHTEGNVILYDGFVNKIQAITEKTSMHVDQFSNEKCILKAPLFLHNVSIVYDVLFKFKDYEGSSMFVFTFDEIELSYQVIQNLRTKDLETHMELKAHNCKGFTTKAHPYEKHAQMGLKGIENSGNSKFCDNIKKSIQQWKLPECLQKAVTEIGFARVCYYC